LFENVEECWNEFDDQPITQTLFDSLWRSVETVAGYSLLRVSSEWKSLNSIFHKYGLVTEYLHKTLSDTSTTSNDPIIINGIYHHIENINATIRNKTDSYLVRIKRGIMIGSKYLAVTSENAIITLIQQLSILGHYIIASNTRIVVKEVIHILIEELLKIKAKLIDFALNYSNSLY